MVVVVVVVVVVKEGWYAGPTRDRVTVWDGNTGSSILRKRGRDPHRTREATALGRRYTTFSQEDDTEGAPHQVDVDRRREWTTRIVCGCNCMGVRIEGWMEVEVEV